MAVKRIFLEGDEFKFVINGIDAVSGDGICVRCAHVDKSTTYSEMAQGHDCTSCGEDGIAGLLVYNLYRSI